MLENVIEVYWRSNLLEGHSKCSLRSALDYCFEELQGNMPHDHGLHHLYPTSNVEAKLQLMYVNLDNEHQIWRVHLQLPHEPKQNNAIYYKNLKNS